MDLHRMHIPVLDPKSFWELQPGGAKDQAVAANHLGERRGALFLEGQHSSRRPRAARSGLKWGGARRERARGGAPGARPEGRGEELWAWLRLGAGGGGSRELGS